MPFDATDAYVEIQELKHTVQYILNVLIEKKLIEAPKEEKTEKKGKDKEK